MPVVDTLTVTTNHLSGEKTYFLILAILHTSIIPASMIFSGVGDNLHLKTPCRKVAGRKESQVKITSIQ